MSSTLVTNMTGKGRVPSGEGAPPPGVGPAYFGVDGAICGCGGCCAFAERPASSEPAATSEVRARSFVRFMKSSTALRRVSRP